jgi:glycosyltransferase involved in cell wall biosynthesis
MLKNEILIINTSGPLRNYMKRRPSHYAEILSQHNRVINISWVKRIEKAKFTANKPKWEEQIFFRLPGTRFRVIHRLNTFLYKMHIKRFIKSLPHQPILWHFYSGNFDLYKDIDCKLSVLEICDDTPEFFAGDLEKCEEVKKNENRMTQHVDVVFTISEYLQEKRAKLRPDIEVIRNGVVVEDFSGVHSLEKQVRDELFLLKPPIVGYTGAISLWFDFDLVEQAARQLPEVNFVFVGRIIPENRSTVIELNKKENIFFLGEKDYQDLPHYLKYFDVTLIPFKINELIKSVNPIKLYEYLAAGKPVVSTPLPEVIRYKKKGIIEIIDDPVSFAKVFKMILANWDDDKRGICLKIAQDNTWQKRVSQACSIIEKKLD